MLCILYADLCSYSLRAVEGELEWGVNRQASIRTSVDMRTMR